MHIRGRTTRATLVWAVALLTLATSFPRLDCRCPDGRLKTLCLWLAPGECCCAGSCCPAANAHGYSNTKARGAAPRGCPACRSAGRASDASGPGEDRAVGGTACERALAHAAPRMGAAPAEDGNVQLKHLHVAPILTERALGPAPHWRRARFDFTLPAPDLVVLLRHFVI